MESCQKRTKWKSLMAAAVLIGAVAFANETNSTAIKDVRAATLSVLRPIGTLVGDWKGVGQPKRGSSSGAWSEKAIAVWKFDEDQADLVVTFDPGQQIHTATFSLGDDGSTPQLVLAPLNGESMTLVRIEPTSAQKDHNESWIFESAVKEGPQWRCTLRLLSDIRVTILFEEKSAEKSAWRRLSEIGLTRAGARLASGNTGERQCLVTGGLGTIKVSWEGSTYYVCCEGCKQAFDADPAGTIDAYRERLKEAGTKRK
jgi:hypothetical protein